MPLLQSRIGLFNLENAVRIDIYHAHEAGLHHVHFWVDGSSTIIASFESKQDADSFVEKLKTKITDWLLEHKERYKMLDLSTLVGTCVHETSMEVPRG